MKIKIFSSDDVQALEQVVNAYLEIHRNAKIHFSMAAPNEEASAPGELPKTGGPYIEYGICVEFEESAPQTA